MPPHICVPMSICFSNTGITVEEIAAKADIKLSTLSKECSQNLLLNLAAVCIKWTLIGKRLGLTEADITAVDCDKRTEEEKRVGMLEKWKERFSFKATFKSLIKALLAEGMSKHAFDAAKIIREATAAGTCKYMYATEFMYYCM